MTKLLLTFIAFTFLFLLPHSRCHDSPDSPPAPPVSSPAPSHSPFASPPGPWSVYLAPETSPGPSPSWNGQIYGFHHSPSPAPAPTPTPVAADMNHAAIENFEAAKDSSNGGSKGGHTAGITVGVIAGVCVVGLGAMVYKKRQQNIRRAQYGYTSTIELL